jgi:hypothetical protein
MTAFAAAIDVLFADPNVARDAVWRAGGSAEGIAIRIIRKAPDQTVSFGESRAILTATLIDVRRSEVASPAIGDTLDIEGETFEIIASPMIDGLGLVWTCEAAAKP